jgi:hypothetical protein
VHARGGAAGTRHHPVVPHDDIVAGIQHDEAALDEIEETWRHGVGAIGIAGEHGWDEYL